MFKIIYLSVVSFFFILNTPLQAQGLKGLKKEVLLRHMGYIHSPESRDKFTTFGSIYKYRKTQKDKIRNRLNPNLERLRKTLSETTKQGSIGLTEYDPTMKFRMMKYGNYQDLENLSYPMAVRIFLPKSDSFRDKEFICFSLNSKPGLDKFKALVDQVKDLIESGKPVPKDKARQYKTEKEQELFEALKDKTIEYYWYEPYFGVYLGGDFLVDSEYGADARKKVKAKFDAVYDSFKTRYFTTSENSLRSLVNSEIVKDIQNIIEQQGYATHLIPFSLERSKLPKNIFRIEKKINEVQLIIVFGVNGESLNPKNRAIIMDFVNKSQSAI